ncbi:MAG: hypothetical protein GY838_14445 [bacterium]|nr:hypothetical protein [bacterium]
MMRSITLSALLIVLALAAACTGPDEDLATLTTWMTGSFGSGAQAVADSSYFDIQLEMVPVWTDREDARWFYVEQAVATAKERPYRQRVYRVRRLEGDVFESAVFSLPEPEQHIGAWRDAEPLAGLGPEDLEVREGCAVLLRRDGAGRFAGSTVDQECVSSLRGAAYATSEVIIEAGRIESWDRGFDADSEQVWGAVKGAYVFDRLGDPAP